MFVFKGFMSHGLMASNVPGQTATVGELSAYSRTYSRELGYYGTNLDPAYGEFDLTSFKCEKDGVKIVAPANIVNEIFDICKYVLDKTISSANPIFSDELLAELITQFSTTAEQFQCGAIVTDGRYYAPEWLSWKSKQAFAGPDNLIRIWFSDGSFQLQYDEYEIVVVPPFTPLSDFYQPGSQVDTKLTAATPLVVMDAMMTARGQFPETVFEIHQFDWIDPLNAAHRVTSNWGVLIYGLAGHNIDSIKDALVAYILGNSVQTREQWLLILPEIFKRTEFILLPRWDQYSIPNRTVEAGIHSPISNLTESLQKARDLLEYPDAHINSHTAVFTHPYKAVSVLVVGGPENRDNLWELVQVFPDFINVSSTSLDFNRMTNATKNWALLLEEMLLAAETVTEFSSVPLGMTKMRRGEVLYVVKSFGNIHYLVATKASIAPAVIPV